VNKKIDLKEALRLHSDWLCGRAGGVRAHLSGADLSGADLSCAYLSGADLSCAYLSGADLSGAYLRSAYLRSAYLSGANLRSADLSGADLSCADLSGAELSGAKDVSERWQVISQIVPQVGAFQGYKKCKGGLVAHLEIPATALRVGGCVGRKCRVSAAKVLALYESKGKKSRKKTASSTYSDSFLYTVGKTVKPAGEFDANRLVECASGIHLFLSFEEAAAYV